MEVMRDRLTGWLLICRETGQVPPSTLDSNAILPVMPQEFDVQRLLPAPLFSRDKSQPIWSLERAMGIEPTSEVTAS
jgi:hypothetical protein